MAEPLLVILGPTATGKTDVGLLVAEVLGGEIVSADSMQVYRGMDIGTAKPGPEQLARVPHHLIGIIAPDEPFSVADYQARADASIADIRHRGRLPVVVGGSGLYLRALVDRMSFPIAPPDPCLRQRLAEEAREVGSAALHARLAEVDPESAARIHPRDLKRIIRAFEVYAQTGLPRSQAQAVDPGREVRYNARRFGLWLPRTELYRRIEERVERMLAAGLVEEVKRLLDQGYGEHLVSMQGLGYAQIAAYLRGECDLAEAVRRLKRDTRRFAKRQLTWFRRDQRIEWVDVAERGGTGEVARYIRERWTDQCHGAP